MWWLLWTVLVAVVGFYLAAVMARGRWWPFGTQQHQPRHRAD